MTYVLLIAGLFFPALSWLTMIVGAVASTKDKHVSAVYIPFIGPILLDCWLLLIGAPAWCLILPWVLDIGTVLVLVFLVPEILTDMWRTARFNRVLRLTGRHENQTATLSFYRSGEYHLEKKWRLEPGEAGCVGRGEPGTYEYEGDNLILVSHAKRERQIIKIAGHYVVKDTGPADELSLDQWTFYDDRA